MKLSNQFLPVHSMPSDTTPVAMSSTISAITHTNESAVKDQIKAGISDSVKRSEPVTKENVEDMVPSWVFRNAQFNDAQKRAIHGTGLSLDGYYENRKN